MILNTNKIDLLKDLTKVENNTMWELVKLSDENNLIILDMDIKKDLANILNTTIGNLNKTICNLYKNKEILDHKPNSQKYYLNKSLFRSIY